MTENLPQTQQSNLMPSAQEFQMLQVIAKNAQDSGLYSGVGQQAKIFMVLLAARELGVSPMLALNGGIWNIQGKIEISARLMNGLIRRAGHSINIIRSDDEACILQGKRSDGDSCEISFTKEDAIKAGLWGLNTWKKYPSDMLYNRCMSRLARRLFSDVIGTAYCEGEIKEAKEVEKLEQAEYEVKPNITDLKEENKLDLPKNDEKVTPEKDPEPKISKEDLQLLVEQYISTTDDFKINCEKYIQDNWGIKGLEELTHNQSILVMKWIYKNMQAQAEGAVK